MANVQIKKGFSIIEFMVVIAILSIAVVQTLPDFSKWILSVRMKNVAESIAFGVMQARSYAIKGGEDVYLSLNEDGTWYIFPNYTAVQHIEYGDIAITNKMSIAVTPSNAKTIIFDQNGVIINDFKSNPTKYTIAQPTKAYNIFGVGPIQEITIGLANGDETINDIKVKISQGGSVLTCIDFKIDNNLPNNCKNIQF